MHQPEYYASRLNPLRMAGEIDAYNNPDRVVGALPALLLEGQTNNERFNALLNSCQNPRAIYNALTTFAEVGEAVSV